MDFGQGLNSQSAEPMPTAEELMALLEMLEQQGITADQAPPDIRTLLENVKREKAAKGKGVAATPEGPTEEITPEPGFVIKTAEQKSGQKVFINVCASDRVTAPGGWQGGVMPDEVAAALEKLQSGAPDPSAAMSAAEVESLRFPLACGPPRADTDRRGEACTAVDVVFNADVVRAAAVNRRLKALLIEIATGWVGRKLGGELDEKYKLPKMRYKGEVVERQRIRAEDKQKPLVTELRDIDEEPTFALRTTPAPQLLQPAPAPAPASKGVAAAATPTGSAKAPGAAQAASAGAAALTPATATAGDAAASSGAAPYKVEYEGRPVEWVVVTIDLEPPPASAAVEGYSSGRQGQDQAQGPPQVAVEACGRSLYLRQPGRPELHVPLQFAVSAAGASAQGRRAPGPGGRPQLRVRLPYRSLDEHVADARAQAPLPYGQLSFASKALLDLEP